MRPVGDQHNAILKNVAEVWTSCLLLAVGPMLSAVNFLRLPGSLNDHRIINRYAPRNTNMNGSPENGGTFRRVDSGFGSHHFQVPFLIFGGCTSALNRTLNPPTPFLLQIIHYTFTKHTSTSSTRRLIHPTRPTIPDLTLLGGSFQ